MTIRLIHVHQLETFYLCYGGQMSIWGHWGPKVVFHYKCYNLSMLHSLAIRLIRVHQLVTLFLFYGVKCQSRVIWGHWGRKVIFAKKALTRPWYIAWPYDSYMSISLRPSIFVSGSNVNLGSTWGHPGRVRRLWRQQCLVLFCFCFFKAERWPAAFPFKLNAHAQRLNAHTESTKESCVKSMKLSWSWILSNLCSSIALDINPSDRRSWTSKQKTLAFYEFSFTKTLMTFLSFSVWCRMLILLGKTFGS